MATSPEIELEEDILRETKGIHKEQVPDVKQKRELVELLLNCPTIQGNIHVIKDELPPHIANAIKTNDSRKIYALNIVNACMNCDDGLKHLLETVQFFDDETKPFQNLKTFINRLADTDSASSSKVESQGKEILKEKDISKLTAPEEESSAMSERDISITVSTRLDCDGGAQALFDALHDIDDKNIPSIRTLKQTLTEFFQIAPKH